MMDLVYFISLFIFIIFLYVLLLTKGKEDKNITLLYVTCYMSQSHKSHSCDTMEQHRRF